MASEEPEVTIRGENAEIRVRRVLTGNGERLEISAPKRGFSVQLDAVELESLTWQTHETFAELRRVSPLVSDDDPAA